MLRQVKALIGAEKMQTAPVNRSYRYLLRGRGILISNSGSLPDRSGNDMYATGKLGGVVVLEYGVYKN